jgi:hypothetical protein
MRQPLRQLFGSPFRVPGFAIKKQSARQRTRVTGGPRNPIVFRRLSPQQQQKTEAKMPVILWLLGVPLSLILVLWLVGVF